MPCEASENQLAIDESKFWDANGIHWSPHRIGWAIAGGCTALTVIISIITVLQHCRNYTNPRQQRQILRILYMPPVYAAISFLSYRFFRYYTYYSFVYIIYEAITLSAFLMLLIEYVAATATGNSADKAIERKDKRPLPLPFCCWRYRPTKAYFMYTVKWSVMQYIIVRPAASVAGIVCEHYHVLCHTEGYSLKYASVYIESINFVSISIALYGLLVFYGLMAEELKGKRPVAKFLSIKLIVMFTFYQAFVFKALQGRVIHATTYWTETNIANGLNALAICVEMVIFSGLMWWAYTAKEYTRQAGTPPTGIWRPLWDSINYMDFFREIGYSFRFFFTRKPHPESVSVVESKSSSIPYQPTPSMQYRTVPQQDQRMSFAEAFGIAEYQQHPQHQPRSEVAGNTYPLTTRNFDPEERQRLRPAVSPNLEPTFPQQHLQPGVESQRPLSEGEDLDLGYYSSAYEGIEEAAYPQPRQEVVYPQQGPQPAYPPQPPQQLQPGYNAAAGARDSFQAWTGPRAL